MRLTDHVTFNFNNSMDMEAVLFYIEKAFDTTWYRGLLYKLSKLQLSPSVIKCVTSCLSNRQFRTPGEAGMATLREMQGDVPQASVLPCALYSIYI
jgi:hypothetical protein